MKSVLANFAIACLLTFAAGLDLATGDVPVGVGVLALAVALMVAAARLLWLKRQLWILEGCARGERATLAHIASGGVKAIRFRLRPHDDIHVFLEEVDEKLNMDKKLNEKAPE